MNDQARATNFAESVCEGYHLSTILTNGPRKFSFRISPAHPFTERMTNIIIGIFEDKGIDTSSISRGEKRYPSTSPTLRFSTTS